MYDFTAVDVPGMEIELTLAREEGRNLTAEILECELDRVKDYQYLIGEKLPYFLKK